MEIYGKSLIYVVFILISLIIVQNIITKLEGKTKLENFGNIKSTVVQNMVPNEGDSSTIVKLEGVGFSNVSKIFFKIGSTYSQCIILNNRKDTSIEVIPPAITELGKNILDIRNNIKTNLEGLKADVIFVAGDPTKDIDYSLNLEGENVVTVQGLNFYYIDRLPYKNNCPIPPEPPSISNEPATTPETDELPEELPLEFEQGSDLEFLNKILPEKEDKLNKLYQALNKNFDKYAKLNTDKVEELEKIQALETLDEMKKQLNYERYVITENLKPHEEREKNKNNMLS